jgi:hypothetical protein
MVICASRIRELVGLRLDEGENVAETNANRPTARRMDGRELAGADHLTERVDGEPEGLTRFTRGQEHLGHR